MAKTALVVFLSCLTTMSCTPSWSSPDTEDAGDDTRGTGKREVDGGLQEARDAEAVRQAPMSTEPDASRAPAPECDDDNPCTAGYACEDDKCVSACAGKSCDTNATCALSDGAAVCTCNNGFLAQGSSDAPTCAADLACSELGCDTNATCAVGANKLRSCVCKPGYEGTGLVCEPVRCEALSIDNGTVDVHGGTFGQSATYECNAGYTKTAGSARVCEVGGWSGTAPKCEPFDCWTPLPPAHGRIEVVSGTRYPTGKLKYSCDNGYKLTPSTETRTCGATGWSGADPACLGCGDGIVTAALGEECETGLFVSPWDCVNCKRTGDAYKACPLSQQGEPCGGGLTCSLGGFCTVVACKSLADCPAVPAGLGTTAVCYDGFDCSLRCTSTLGCPGGTVCTDGLCVRCTEDTQCIFPQICGESMQLCL